MKKLYMIVCLVVSAGCRPCAEREVEEAHDEVVAQRLTVEWKRVMEDELDTLKGDYIELARYVRQTVHLQSWLLTKRDQALPEHKAIYQEILDHMEAE